MEEGLLSFQEVVEGLLSFQEEVEVQAFQGGEEVHHQEVVEVQEEEDHHQEVVGVQVVVVEVQNLELEEEEVQL